MILTRLSFVLNHILQEKFAFGDKISYTLYLKHLYEEISSYIFEAKASDRVDAFKANM